MTRKQQDDEFTLRQIRRAHDVLEGCLVSLSISESARGTLLDQLRILYEFSSYPIVLKPTGGSTGSRRSGIRGLSFQPSIRSDVTTSEESSAPVEETGGWERHLEEPHGDTQSRDVKETKRE